MYEDILIKGVKAGFFKFQGETPPGWPPMIISVVCVLHTAGTEEVYDGL